MADFVESISSNLEHIVIPNYHTMSHSSSVRDLLVLTYLINNQEVKINKTLLAQRVEYDRRSLHNTLEKMKSEGLIEESVSGYRVRELKTFPIYRMALGYPVNFRTPLAELMILDFLQYGFYSHDEKPFVQSVKAISIIKNIPLRSVERALYVLREKNAIRTKTLRSQNCLVEWVNPSFFASVRPSTTKKSGKFLAVKWEVSGGKSGKFLAVKEYRKEKDKERNTSYFFLHLISFEERGTGCLSAAGTENGLKEETGGGGQPRVLHNMIEEVLMEKFRKIEEEVIVSHRKKAGTIMQSWRLIKSYFPDCNPAPSYLEKALLKNVLSVCSQNNVSFEDYVARVAEKKDDLLREKSLRLAFEKSVIFLLDNPITYRLLNHQPNNGPEETAQEEHIPVVVFPVKSLFISPKEVAQIPLNIRNGRSNTLSLREALDVLRKHKKFELSSEDFKSEFIQFLLERGLDPNDYTEEIQRYSRMTKKEAVAILKTKISEGLRCQ